MIRLELLRYLMEMLKELLLNRLAHARLALKQGRPNLSNERLLRELLMQTET